MAAQASAILAGVAEVESRRIWFDRSGCVEQQADGRYVVLRNGTALGIFDEDDPATRDILITVVASTGANRQHIAVAFRVSDTTVERALTRLHQGGLKAVADTGHQGGRTIQTPKLLRRLNALFEQGLGPRAAHREVAKSASYGTVQGLHKKWRAAQDAGTQSTAAVQIELDVPANDATGLVPEALPALSEGADETTSGVESAPTELGVVAPDPEVTVAMREEQLLPDGNSQQEDESGADAAVDTALELLDGGRADLEPAPSPSGTRTELPLEQVVGASQGQIVQHVGAWLLVGMVNALGMYDLLAKWRGKSANGVSLRVCVDAAAIAFALGENCVEGVRRLDTPSVGILLRHRGAVSASWVRRVLKSFAEKAGLMFQATVAAMLLQRSAGDDERVWMYVDNHMRPYTGKHTIRKGWRMQDKRALPGVSDYYVHDEDGFPLWRVATTAHESLCEWLGRIVKFAKLALGDKVIPAVVFDRAGSFPMMMATLRALGAEFVTYERKPYALLTPVAFDQQLTLQLASRPKRPIVIRYTEAPQKNLGVGRGRVRRIALLMHDGAQINVLALSPLPAEALIRKLLARWGCQENQFKYEVERWGINHLDGRAVEEYPPDAIIPNPARNKIEHQLRLASAAEGAARCDLARLPAEHPRRARLEEDLRRAIERQDELQKLRPNVPKRAPVSKTPLAGKLRRHLQVYKNVLDTLRIALANAESDLAFRLAEHLDRPREAKKFLANLINAPGTVRVTPRAVSVRLAPAATKSERAAYAAFLRDVNRLGLSLPGDGTARLLRFGLMPSDR